MLRYTPFRHPKRRGELAELRFLLRAAEAGFTVSKPYGDSARFDFIVGDRFPARVQVRSTSFYSTNRAFVCRLTRGNPPVRYKVTDFDFLAVYIVPHQLWYIIPTMELNPRHRNVTLYAHVPHSRGRMEHFREAWHLLANSRRSKGP
jgi:hypothetical protein